MKKPVELDDRELLRLAAEGDSRAYDRLVKQLEPDLVSFLRGRLRTAPDVAVEDVLQEVRLYLFQRLDRYNPEYPVAVFARGLAKNVAKRFVYGKRDLMPAGYGEEGDERDPTDLSPTELEQLPLSFREVMGVGRFENPGGPPPPSRVFLELLEVFFRYGGYPHQQVCFGYSILLWGKEKKRASSKGASKEAAAAGEASAGAAAAGSMPSQKVPVTGDPDRVVREVASKELRPSSGQFLDELGGEGKIDADYLGRVRRPLDHRLALNGEGLFERDAASLDRFAGLREREIGSTRLEEYFGTDPRKSVSEWTHAVKNRVKRAFTDPDSRRRIPLPDFPGGSREV